MGNRGETGELPALGVSSFDRHCGLELVESGPDRVLGVAPVVPELLQPTGVVHGGVYAAIAEGTASLGCNHAIRDRGLFALGMSNTTSFMRPIAAGSIHAEARPVHIGAGTAVWDVELRDDQERLCAVSRVTLALREMTRPG